MGPFNLEMQVWLAENISGTWRQINSNVDYVEFEIDNLEDALHLKLGYSRTEFGQKQLPESIECLDVTIQNKYSHETM